jgi:hypothetical protein
MTSNKNNNELASNTRQSINNKGSEPDDLSVQGLIRSSSMTPQKELTARFNDPKGASLSSEVTPFSKMLVAVIKQISCWTN